MCGMKDCVKVRARSLADRIIDLVEAARQKTVSAVNLAMVYTYFEIGRQIVLEEQGGARGIWRPSADRSLQTIDEALWPRLFR